MQNGTRIATFRDHLLSWLDSRFAHPEVGLLHESADSPIGGVYDRAKALGELALICRVADRFPDIARDDGVMEIRRYLSTHARAEIRNIQRSDSFPYCLRMALALEACGEDPELYRPCVLRTMPLSLRDGTQWQERNAIEVKYYLEILGINNDMPDFLYLFRRSRIRTKPDVTSLRRWDVYEMAHTIFCVSDFGRRDPRVALGGYFLDTCGYCDVLLRHLTDREDWDLVAELLICCSSLGHRPDPQIIDAAWQGLTAAEARCTAAWRSSDESAASMRREDEFAECFHTAVVALIAAILESECPNPRRPNIRSGEGRHGKILVQDHFRIRRIEKT
jgi:hypothetical protein